MKIIFLLETISQPRCIKRVRALHEEGHECVVYGYDRKKSSVNLFPSSIQLNILGEMKDGGNYFAKFVQMKRDLSLIVNRFKNEEVIYYGFGFIFSLLLRLYGRRFIYEISDILYGYPKFNAIRPLLKYIDRLIIRGSLFTVMTSEGFKKYLAPQSCKIVLQPNKISPQIAQLTRKAQFVDLNDGVRFSFVGRMRYQTILFFAKVIGEKYPEHTFNFYGDASGDMLDACLTLQQKYPNVKYHGVYKNPEDLEKIYSNTDVVVSCYSTHGLNERLAEPNKLYEALFFCKPIIVSDGIFLAEQVRRYSCGYCIDATSIESISEFVGTIKNEELNTIMDHISSIRKDTLIDSISDVTRRIQEIK